MSRSLPDWLARIEALDISRIELGLGRVKTVLDRMALFRARRPLVITVAGTNGKGSSVALLEAILREQGRRVGAYTSPHLHHFSERIRLDGEPVEAALLVDAFERVEAARQAVPLTYFEYATLAALACFEQAASEVILLEVGLGGRLDAVNAVDADLALITSISLDHADWLGTDIEAIAREKAGIMRPGRPAVFAGRHCPAALIAHACSLNAPLYRLGEAFEGRFEDGVLRFENRDAGEVLSLPPPALAGVHQHDNAAGVLMALRLLSERLPVDEAAIRRGLRQARHAGRAESFQVDGRAVLLDVAHNPEGCAALAALLAARHAERRQALVVHAVFAALADKDIAAMPTALLPWVEHWYLAGLPGPRGLTATALSQRLECVANLQISARETDPLQAYNHAFARSKPGELIVVFGSFLTVAAVRRQLTTGN